MHYTMAEFEKGSKGKTEECENDYLKVRDVTVIRQKAIEKRRRERGPSKVTEGKHESEDQTKARSSPRQKQEDNGEELTNPPTQKQVEAGEEGTEAEMVQTKGGFT